MYTAVEKRFFERHKCNLAVRYVPEEQDSKEYDTITKDISGGGARISLLKRVTPGTVLDLELFRNDSNIGRRCKGEVRWVDDSPVAQRKEFFEAGVRFKDLSLLYVSSLISDLKPQTQA